MTDQELVDKTYDIAGDYLAEKVSDWTDYKKWTESVNELSRPLRNIYLIGILVQEVMNGGFIQYYDNGYGIFAHETLGSLKDIKAINTLKIVEKSIVIIKGNDSESKDFKNFIINRKYRDYEKKGDLLDELDYKFCNYEGREDLEALAATYLRSLEKK